MWGTRTAIFVGVLIEGITLLIGIIIGAIASFYGGWVDEVLMRFTEIFMAFPFIMAALTLSAILTPIMGRGIWPPTIALIVFGWMTYARLIRGDILSIRERDFVTAARVVGASDGAHPYPPYHPQRHLPHAGAGFDGHRHVSSSVSPR